MNTMDWINILAGVIILVNCLLTNMTIKNTYRHEGRK